MRIISQLGAEDTQIKKRSKKTKEDTFGMNDEDWNVYRDIVSEKNLTFDISPDWPKTQFLVKNLIHNIIMCA
jgi:hypothetical protein